MDARRVMQAMVIPLPNDATLQTPFLVTTRRDGAILAHAFVAPRLFGTTKLRGSLRGLHQNRRRRAREIL
jgi:hypothetical protein